MNWIYYDVLKLKIKTSTNLTSAASLLACENIRLSSRFTAGDVSRGGTSATQRQKFHTDDANQCLHNKSDSHGAPNINLSNFTSPGLQITAGQRTMSGQNWVLTGQILGLPDILSGPLPTRSKKF